MERPWVTSCGIPWLPINESKSGRCIFPTSPSRHGQVKVSSPSSYNMLCGIWPHLHSYSISTIFCLCPRWLYRFQMTDNYIYVYRYNMAFQSSAEHDMFFQKEIRRRSQISSWSMYIAPVDTGLLLLFRFDLCSVLSLSLSAAAPRLPLSPFRFITIV